MEPDASAPGVRRVAISCGDSHRDLADPSIAVPSLRLLPARVTRAPQPTSPAAGRAARTGSRRWTPKPSRSCAPHCLRAAVSPSHQNRDLDEPRRRRGPADCAHSDRSTACPALTGKRVRPHVLQHTAAMRLLAAGIDSTVIALWLGNESIDTIHIYPHADMQIKDGRWTGPHPAAPIPDANPTLTQR